MQVYSPNVLVMFGSIHSSTIFQMFSPVLTVSISGDSSMQINFVEQGYLSVVQKYII